LERRNGASLLHWLIEWFKMGRKALPTHLKIVKGTARKDRLNPYEPQPKRAQPNPPAFLSIEAQAEWNLVVQELFDLGVLTNIDRAVLAAYCEAFGRWQRASLLLEQMAKHDELGQGLMVRTISGNTIQNPIVGIANKSMSDVVRFAAELGLTPSARSRIHATPQNQNEDPVAQYLR